MRKQSKDLILVFIYTFCLSSPAFANLCKSVLLDTTLQKIQKLFNLTPAQSEAIYWMSIGKTSPDIADIMGNSHNTVRKHLEKAFERMTYASGQTINNRTTATALVLRALGKNPPPFDLSSSGEMNSSFQKSKIAETIKAQYPSLTETELLVIHEVVSGKTNEAIAQELGNSPLTVKKHIEKIYIKLNVFTRSGLTKWLYDVLSE